MIGWVVVSYYLFRSQTVLFDLRPIEKMSVWDRDDAWSGTHNKNVGVAKNGPEKS